MPVKETNNGKQGGWLKGKRHYDSDGKPIGGIKAVVGDSKKPVELEGGEVIINRKSAEKHWKTLSKINQDGGGVPITPPNKSDEDPQEYEDGGKIQFNMNAIPRRNIVQYAERIKKDYPEIWAKAGNIFGNEAFVNLQRVSKRGYWEPDEEWMFIKWKSYIARHKKDFRIEGVIAMLKWIGTVEKGWPYMKAMIDIEIKKHDQKAAKKQKGGELEKGIETEAEHKDSIKKIASGEVPVKKAPEAIAKDHLKEDPDYYTKLQAAKLEKGGSVLLAPNGKPSNLNPVQYKLVRTEAFKNWFGDWEKNPEAASKVIDENGEPLVVYHGAVVSNIKTFDRELSARRSSGLLEYGLYFSTNKKLAKLYSEAAQPKAGITPEPKVYEVFLNLKKIKEFDAEYGAGSEAWWKLKVDAGYKIATGRDAMLFLKEGKFDVPQVDGILAKNIADLFYGSSDPEEQRKALKDFYGDVYLVFDGNPNFIKMADGSNTQFSPDSDNIYFEQGGKITTAQKLKQEIAADPYLKPSNLSDLEDFDTALQSLRELDKKYGQNNAAMMSLWQRIFDRKRVIEDKLSKSIRKPSTESQLLTHVRVLADRIDIYGVKLQNPDRIIINCMLVRTQKPAGTYYFAKDSVDGLYQCVKREGIAAAYSDSLLKSVFNIATSFYGPLKPSKNIDSDEFSYWADTNPLAMVDEPETNKFEDGGTIEGSGYPENYRPVFWHLTKKEFCDYIESATSKGDNRITGKIVSECEDYYKYAVVLPLLHKSNLRNHFLLAIKSGQLTYEKAKEIIDSVNGWDKYNPKIEEIITYDRTVYVSASMYTIPKHLYLSTPYFIDNFTKSKAIQHWNKHLYNDMVHSQIQLHKWVSEGIVKIKDLEARVAEFEGELKLKQELQSKIDYFRRFAPDSGIAKAKNKIEFLITLLDANASRNGAKVEKWPDAASWGVGDILVDAREIDWRILEFKKGGAHGPDMMLIEPRFGARPDDKLWTTTEGFTFLKSKADLDKAGKQWFIQDLQTLWTKEQKQFVEKLVKDNRDGIKYNKSMLEKAALQYGLKNKNEIKEMAELSICFVARGISQDDSLNAKQKYDKIVALYENQVNMSHRTSESILLQQYSTPAPIGYLAGLYCGFDRALGDYFEPSAGNGLLTIAGKASDFTVNEIDKTRLKNLSVQGFKEISNNDASKPFTDFQKKFNGVITNPPFGRNDEVKYEKYSIKSLEQLMAIYALETMKNDGKCAIIIGGHMEADADGMIRAGKNRIFFLYLYKHYNVEDVINISGRHLYSRQGTSFNTRLILINGRKSEPSGLPPFYKEPRPMYEPNSLEPVDTFDVLWNRVHKSINKEG
jgi:predicted RNA methylase